MTEINRDDLLQLIPAYVLGALDPDEQAQVETLLVDDTEAQTLAEEYRQMTAEVLPFIAEAQILAPDLKNRLFERIREESPAKSSPTQDVSTDDNLTQSTESQSQNIRRLSFFLPLAAVIVFAVIGLGLVLQNAIVSETPEGIFNTLINQADSTLITAEGIDDSGVRGELIVASSDDRAALRLSQLPTLQSDQTFQLWLVDPDGAQSGGIFQSDDNQEVFLVIPNDQPITQYNRFGVSIEPAGGSPLGDAPSGNAIIGITIPAETEQEQ